MFELDPQLAKDTLLVGHFPLCEVRLMNDARFPWLILVPRREAITEIFQLSHSCQEQLCRESSFVASKMMDWLSADKMNIAALGNIVPQLHIHHIARFQQDEAWPAPVWGKGDAVPYQAEEITQVLTQLKQQLADYLQGDDNEITF